jgi:hypothetical protein
MEALMNDLMKEGTLKRTGALTSTQMEASLAAANALIERWHCAAQLHSKVPWPTK